ncbi:hypothetical protein HN51_062281, partial [Arachis hypogaea]
LHQRKQTLASTNLVAVCQSEKLLLPPLLHSRTSIFVLLAFATSISPTPVRSPSPVRSHESLGRRRPRAQQLSVVRRRSILTVSGLFFVFFLSSVQKSNPLRACSSMVFSKLKEGRFLREIELKNLITKKMANSRLADEYRAQMMELNLPLLCKVE